MKIYLLITFLLTSSLVQSQIITTIAGSGTAGFSGDGGPATSAKINIPFSVVTDKQGNVYIGDEFNSRIRKVNPAGIITSIIGTGTAGFSGDGGLATAAQVFRPRGVAVDSAGNIYFADAGNHRIRKINTSGIVSTVAGSGTMGYTGDGGPATSAQIAYPQNLSIDSAQNIYINQGLYHRIRKITPAGIITTVAGDGTPGFTGEGGTATAAGVYDPFCAHVYNGDLYIDCNLSYRIRKVNAAGIINTVYGTGSSTTSGDGGPASAAGILLGFMTMDKNGNTYLSGYAGQVRKIEATTQLISTIVGNSSSGYASGDGGPATAAYSGTTGICIDAAGSLYLADAYHNTIRKIRNYIPFFTQGSGVSINVCQGVSGPMSLDTLLVATDSNTLQGLKWRVLAHPAHGTFTITDSLAANGHAVTPATSAYSPDTSYVGLDSFSVTVTDSWVSDTILVRVNHLPAHTAITLSGHPVVCNGIDSVFSATPAGGTWRSSAASVASVSATGTVRGISAGSARIFYTTTTMCASDTAVMSVTVLNPVVPTISISASLDSICTGWPAAFSASATHAGSSPGWAWRVRGILSGTSSGFTTSTLLNSDSVTCELTSSEGCSVPQVVTSRAARVRVFPGRYQPSVSVSVTPLIACAGTPLTFTATPTLGGSAPGYKWQRGGVLVGTGNPLSYAASLGDIISCVLTSNDTTVCALTDTATDTVTAHVLPAVTPVITIHTIHSDTVSYLGEIITWVAEVSYEGASPVYQWYHRDGTPIPGATNRTYSQAMYDTNDTLYCQMISNQPCRTGDTAVSNIGIAYGAYLFVHATEAPLPGIKVYPNPTVGIVNIELAYAHSQATAIIVRDILGREQAWVKIEAGSLAASISLMGSPPGAYVVEIISGTNKVVQRLIKE